MPLGFTAEGSTHDTPPHPYGDGAGGARHRRVEQRRLDHAALRIAAIEHGDLLARDVLAHQLAQERFGDAGVGRHKTEHGRHIRPDHAGAFADAGNCHRLAVDLNSPRSGFGYCVGRHDAVRSGMPMVSVKISHAGRQAGNQPINRQWF